MPSTGVVGRAHPTFPRRGWREEAGGGSSDAFGLLLLPLAFSKRERRKADTTDAGECRRAEGGGYKAASDGISQCCR